MKDRALIQRVISTIYEKNIDLKPNERVLIFTDDSRRCDDLTAKDNKLYEIAVIFTEIAKNFTKNVNLLYYPSLCGHGKEPPEELWINAFGEDVVNELKKEGLFKKILQKNIKDNELNKAKEIIKEFTKNPPDVVIALPYYSTSHTNFRKFLTDICKTRYCSMPLFSEEMFYSALQEDFSLLKKRAKILLEKLENCETIIVKSSNGTYLRFSVKDRTFLEDTGDLTSPGSFSNLPAGEVFVAPCENSADGKIVIEYAPTYKLSSPLTLWLNDGNVVHIEGEDNYKNELMNKLFSEENNKKLAEFGIGINSQATNYFNILEAEKIYGTIHLAFGDNSSFGGKIRANFHEDYIISNPTVEIFKKDGSSLFIIKEGNPLF